MKSKKYSVFILFHFKSILVKFSFHLNAIHCTNYLLHENEENTFFIYNVMFKNFELIKGFRNMSLIEFYQAAFIEIVFTILNCKKQYF